MGLCFQVLTADIDETKFETEDPRESVCRICAAKAAAVAQVARMRGLPKDGALILSADTIVVLDGRIMGKPHDEAEARAMLDGVSMLEPSILLWLRDYINQGVEAVIK